MLSEILKDVDNKVEFLEKALNVVRKNEGGEVPGLEEDIKIIQPYFTEDKYFIEVVKKNIRKLRIKFKDEELERSLAWVQANKTRKHLIQRIDEAIGFIEIANGNFNNFRILGFRKINVIRDNNIRQKTDFMSAFIVLTTKDGFKEMQNKFKTDISLRALSIVNEIKDTGYFDENHLSMMLSDEETKLSISLRLACNRY